MVHPEDRTAILAASQRMPHDGSGEAIVLRIRDRAGEWRLLEAVGGSIPDARGEPQQVVLVLRDITERKRAEEQLRRANLELGTREKELLETLEELRRSHEELRAAHLQLIQADKMESVGHLAVGVAHEVKNPLTVILMGIEYVGKRLKSGDSELTAVLSDMDEAVKRANTVVRGLLDFSVPGSLDLKPEPINEVIEKALLLVKHDLSRAGIGAVRDLGEAMPPLVCDRNKIEQVFLNLYLNAIDAMPDGGTLTVRTAVRLLGGSAARSQEGEPSRAGLGEEVLIAEVQDTGTGIPAESLERIYEPFFTTKPSGKGTGLGLTVIKKIVEMHGGAITVRNHPEGGVRVTLTFPLTRSSR